MSKDSPVQDIAAFVAVAQNASFTRAAEQLETSKSNVGKAVQRIETRLGTKLFQRTTRAVRLTEDGETYFEAARTALEGLQDAEIALASRRDEPAGRVRVDIAVGLGTAIVPTLERLHERYPRVTLEMSLDDRHTDPVKCGWDIVVRIGDLPASGDLTVRKLCDLKLGLFASPSYIGRRPAVPTVEDLQSEDGVMYRSNSGKLRPWQVMQEDRIVDVMPRTSFVALDGRTMLDAMKAGLGIGQMFDQAANPFVATGELVQVLPELSVPSLPVHALIPLGRRMPPKTRVVLEHFSTVLRSVS